MPHARSTKAKNTVGLGRAIINKQSQDARRPHQSDKYSVDIDSSTRLQSVTQQQDLEAFLSTAQLAGTDFTAERRNVKIVQTPGVASTQNAHLLSEQEEQSTLDRHDANKDRLRVPRRPPWTKSISTAHLDRQERDSFLDWRRGLAELQDGEGFLLTPFERNLEVWRQLWRVLERSHLIVQIVDARNPLRFRCEDVEKYVADIQGPEGEKDSGPGKRRSLLLINKADMLTIQQRRAWADYFDTLGVCYAFYSAAHATALQVARQEAEGTAPTLFEAETAGHSSSPVNSQSSDEESQNSGAEQDLSDSDDDCLFAYHLAAELLDVDEDRRTKILSVAELEDRFISAAPDLSEFADAAGNPPTKLVIGLVGYPNVGKSSTINSLLGEKKVSVSSTPGKTKHFQTIQLTPSLVLCDCPGLVFPQFSTTKADLVCDGVMPIDQLREHTGPVALLTRRIPKEILEAVYGLSIKVRGAEEGGDGRVTSEDFLVPYAIARGFARAGQGLPDEARAARYVLKDYVNGKLLYCHPPPGTPDEVFNQPTRELALVRVSGKKKAPTTRVTKDADTFISGEMDSIDRDFFQRGSNLAARPFVQGSARHGEVFSRNTVMPHQNLVANDGTPLTGRHARRAAVLQSGEAAHPGKKHHKGQKRTKQRSGKGYD